MPCVLVDVANLAAAVEQALTAPKAADGRRIFVNDDSEADWDDVVESLLPLADGRPRPPSITRDDARQVVARLARTSSLAQGLRRIAAVPQVRGIVKQTPALSRWYRRLRSMGSWLPEGVRNRFARRRAPGPSVADPLAPFTSRLIGHQLRGVRHSCRRAGELLGYRPPIPFGESMAIFRDWYRAYHGYEGPDWALLRELY
jgi:nucleoside-diphosphate-sugar epimerase